MNKREDLPTSESQNQLISGQIIHIIGYGDNRICKIDDGKNEYICEISGPIFLEIDDVIAFKNKETRICTRGFHKNKTIYKIPSNVSVTMGESDEIVQRCFMKANYHKGREAFDEIQDMALGDNLTVSEYMYKNSEDLVYGLNPYAKFYSWWLKHRIYRRLWNLELKKSDIEEYKDCLRCSVADLYYKLVKPPGPLFTVCVDLGLSIKLCKRFKISYTKDDIYLARIARFIYMCSAQLKHVCIGQKVLRKKFPDFEEWKDLLLEKYPILFVNKYYYLEHNYKVVEELTTKFSRMVTSPPSQIDIDFVENDILDERQRAAVIGALNNRIFGIFGGGGSGKTTSTRHIVKNLIKRGIKFVVCGPTGPSVVTIRNSLLGLGNDNMIRERTMTLHKLLLTNGIMFEHIIIDEISMVYHALMYDVITTFPGIRSITIVGDNKQLQPLKWGNLMQELIKSQVIPFVKLKNNYRAKNQIIQFDSNNKLLSTEYCELSKGDIGDVITLYQNLLNQNINSRDIINITPTNKIVNEVNTLIQDVISNKKDNPPFLIDKRGRKFIEGDKVVLLKNNYEIEQMNGDIGVIIAVDTKNKTILVEFAYKAENYTLSTNLYGGDYSYHGDGDTMTTDELALAHSLTIHRAQGLGWSYVILYVPFGKKDVEFFNFYMLYTAISRTGLRCHIIGDISSVKKYFDMIPEDKIDHFAKILVNKVKMLKNKEIL